MILLPTLMMLCISQTENQRRLLLFTWTIKYKKGKKTSKYTQVEVKKEKMGIPITTHPSPMDSRVREDQKK